MNTRLLNTIELLNNKNINYKIIKLKEANGKAKECAEELGFDINSIVKTIMMKSKKKGNFAVALKSSDRIDYAKMKKIIGDKKISTLSVDRMKEIGWIAGECCPLTIPGPLYIDNAVKDLDWIHTGSGDLGYGLEYNREIIEQIRTDIEIIWIDVKEE